jgi:5-methylcytosine-specific restriction protein A
VAVTKGHGNPSWTRDEVILALELYQNCNGQIPGPTDDRVRKLSVELRSFPHHAQAARQPSFRNPDGVAFKLQNLRAVDSGAGLKNTSRIDREVWSEFGLNPQLTTELANVIRHSLEAIDLLPQFDDEEEFSEGKAATKVHLRRERSAKLRKELIASRLKVGVLACDLCQADGSNVDLSIRDSMFECHHVVPLNVSGETKTKVKDTALLCASCHRLLHRTMVINKRWLSIEEAKKHLFS